MKRFRSPVAHTLAVLGLLGLAGPAAALDLQRPSKLVLTPLGNLLVAEVGTANPVNSSRVSIVDSDGNPVRSWKGCRRRSTP